MKKVILTTLAACLFVFACNTELIETSEDVNSVSSELSKKKKKKKEVSQPNIVKECTVKDIMRCDFSAGYKANFWWAGGLSATGNWADEFFASDANNQMTFTEYDNGTAKLTGSTVLGDCTVNVNVWFIDKKDYATFTADGGEFKDEANDCTNIVPENQHYYIIDASRSTITSVGSSCLAEGTYGLRQRPDPDDLGTPNLGVIVGPGAALFDNSDDTAYGLSTWGWMTDLATGEDLWVIDFNFFLDCPQNEGGGCDTAFAKGNSDNDSTCFIEDTFNRWGWTIGPLAPGTDATYNVYAGAGQCDISKGALAGTVNVVYDNNGNASVTYNIDDAFTVTETHTYIGSVKYPTKKNGKSTVAPGQYYVENDLSGDIYVIAHAVVCRE